VGGGGVLNEFQHFYNFNKKIKGITYFTLNQSGFNDKLTLESFSEKYQLTLDSNLSKDTNILKKALFWICGIEKMNFSDSINQEKIVDRSIKEETLLRQLCNFNAVVLIGLAWFAIAFLNKSFF
jgi:hypothetical protein